jgi:hypothetical protein
LKELFRFHCHLLCQKSKPNCPRGRTRNAQMPPGVPFEHPQLSPPSHVKCLQQRAPRVDPIHQHPSPWPNSYLLSQAPTASEPSRTPMANSRPSTPTHGPKTATSWSAPLPQLIGLVEHMAPPLPLNSKGTTDHDPLTSPVRLVRHPRGSQHQEPQRHAL